jgi:hypothetical protein
MERNQQDRNVPFEVKYRHQHTGAGEIRGLVSFCTQKKIPRGYVITREMNDFSILPLGQMPTGTALLKVPAPLACYWLGRSELQTGRPVEPMK